MSKIVILIGHVNSYVHFSFFRDINAIESTIQYLSAYFMDTIDGKRNIINKHIQLFFFFTQDVYTKQKKNHKNSILRSTYWWTIP